LLVNSTALCRTTHRARVEMEGQNGRIHDFSRVVRSPCGDQKHGRKHKRRATPAPSQQGG
jgi:hypothetical protein